MPGTSKTQTRWKDSIIVTGVGLAALYWVCESFMFFFLAPEANLFHHLLGPDLFEVWTRLLVLCIFVIFVSHVQQDNQKRKKAYEKLREQDEKYRLIVENIDEGFFEMNLEGHFTFVNNSVSSILGYSSGELIGKNNTICTDPVDGERMNRITDRVRCTGKSDRLSDFRVKRRDGSVVTVEMSIYLMKDEAGQPIGLRGMIRDISEKIKSDAEKRKLEKQLMQAQKMEAIGNLAGGIAHDFNNILMGMQGNASLMLLNMEEDHPHFEKVKTIERYVEGGAALTKQLLGFARGGKYEVKPLDLNELVLSSADMFGRTKKEIRIHSKLEDKLPSVEADQRQIEQVLLNIFVNAWQAMPDGGTLFIQTKLQSLDPAFCMPHQVAPGPYVSVSITDTGIGMDEGVRNRIFDPFFTTKEKSRGTGLGLASAFGIIKNHGGIITAESQKGHGATFTLYLRASTKKVSRSMPIAHLLHKGTETVLLVDDEALILTVGGSMLEKLGYRVIPAGNGEEAINILSGMKDKVDLVILDLIMPGLDGGKTFDRIRKIDPTLRVLLSSGYALDGQVEAVLKKGCNGFIQKPFTLQELSNKIRSVLDPPDSAA